MADRSLLAVAPVDHPGGAETTLLRLLGGLRARGWETTLTTPGPGPLRDAAVAAGHAAGSLNVGGLAPRTGGRAVLAWPAARRLAREADVVYLNGTVCGRLLPAVRNTGTRTVLHVHDMVHRVPPFWRWADLVFAASGAVARNLEPLDAHVVYGPVDPDPPAVDPPWESDGRPVVAFVGRIEPRKGPLDLVRAVPAIREQVPDVRVIVVGDDPYGFDPRYEREVIAAEEIEHYPWIPDAAGVLRHLDVLVLPSYQEPFGTILAEAMAVGTPVVATRVDGLPEVVEDGVTGALVEPGDPPGLAAGVVSVLERRDELGAGARRRAARFHTDAYVDRVERLLQGQDACPEESAPAAALTGGGVR